MKSSLKTPDTRLLTTVRNTELLISIASTDLSMDLPTYLWTYRPIYGPNDLSMDLPTYLWTYRPTCKDKFVLEDSLLLILILIKSPL